VLEELGRGVYFRPNFDKMAEYCRKQGIRLIVVSAGLDFVIEHFLKQEGLRGLVDVYSAKAEITDKCIEFSFPSLLFEESVSFKDDLVRYYGSQGRRCST
jgi:2-hydroxy-3-keto-5-methylthiopentenyl-1-phosphate phosphatase